MLPTSSQTPYYGRLLRCHTPMRTLSRFISGRFIFAIILVVACIAQEGTPSTPPATGFMLTSADKSKVIYVQDFEVESRAFKQDKGGITGKGMILPPPPPGFPRLVRGSTDPAKEARKLVDLMAKSLVNDLQKAGFKARRISPSEARPTDGLILSGVFTEMDEGNQMRRALIGFGYGAVKMELFTYLVDAASPSQPLYNIIAEKTSGRLPGAAITLNPVVAGAKFVMAKNSPEKTVKKTAAKITSELTKGFNGELVAAGN